MWRYLLVAVCLLSPETRGLFLTKDRPYHASCRVEWTFGVQCNEVRAKLTSQVTQWSDSGDCPDDRCKYEIMADDGNILRVRHNATSFFYINDIEFTFVNDLSGCKVQGFSNAENPYAYFDGSTNYCGMHMLITGSSLDQDPIYREETSGMICTQYAEASC
uniref:Uncharacterized protein LOC111115935 n=1 Tax=Crassostrea virginica TaxID=6565 RepID=A0A8B8C4E6_CRAVI|nr:uncharacterized protein LOC111115935 [Crassostrea virginica]